MLNRILKNAGMKPLSQSWRQSVQPVHLRQVDASSVLDLEFSADPPDPQARHHRCSSIPLRRAALVFFEEVDPSLVQFAGPRIDEPFTLETTPALLEELVIYQQVSKDGPLPLGAEGQLLRESIFNDITHMLTSGNIDDYRDCSKTVTCDFETLTTEYSEWLISNRITKRCV
jgi:hypothetical protein